MSENEFDPLLDPELVRDQLISEAASCFAASKPEIGIELHHFSRLVELRHGELEGVGIQLVHGPPRQPDERDAAAVRTKDSSPCHV